VAWAVSAEVVIGAKRDAALKTLAPVSRFQQVSSNFFFHFVDMHDHG